MANLNVTSTLVFAFVTLILGAVLITVVADQVQTVTSKAGIANETISIASARPLAGNLSVNESKVFTIANPPTTWKIADADCAINDFALRNQTGATLTADTDYVFVTNA